jgi:hypothetical protein
MNRRSFFKRPLIARGEGGKRSGTQYIGSPTPGTIDAWIDCPFNVGLENFIDNCYILSESQTIVESVASDIIYDAAIEILQSRPRNFAPWLNIKVCQAFVDKPRLDVSLMGSSSPIIDSKSMVIIQTGEIAGAKDLTSGSWILRCPLPSIKEMKKDYPLAVNMKYLGLWYEYSNL